MTLLASDLPRAAQLSGAPTWGELSHLYSARLTALVLSFLIAGVFWFSHHRRLMRQPYGSRSIVFINLFFLLSIILLPVTSSLEGSYGQSSVVAVLYGLHLSTIAAFNAWLWWIATRDRPSHNEFRRALLPLLLLLLGTLVAVFAPQYARYFWLLAFGGVLLRRSSFADKGGNAGD